MTLAAHRQPIDAPAPTRVIATFNAYHLGDQLLTLHYLRAQAKAHPEIHFTHAARAEYLPQLAPLTADLPNLTLSDLNSSTSTSPLQLAPSVDAWLGASGWFYAQPDRHDFVAIYLRHFTNLSERLGLTSPFTTARDLLFDYPALAPTNPAPRYRGITGVLVVNSEPQSGQFQGYSYAGFEHIIGLLIAAGRIVYTTRQSTHREAICTRLLGASVTDIGRHSTDHLTAIIGVPTGPLWPTFNIWSAHTVKRRILLLDTERVDILPESTVHANHLSLVPELLQTHGLL